MRIARILTRLNLGGPARQALAADPVLRQRGHEVRLFTGTAESGEGDLFDRFLERGLDVVRVPGLRRRPGPIADFRAGRFLRSALREFRPDVVHTHASKAGLLGRRAAWSVGAATVHTFHGHVLEGYFPERISRMLRTTERKLAERTDAIVAVSHATADDLVRLEVVPEQRVVVVPPGVDLAALLELRARSGFLRRLVGADENALLVGVLGRLAEVKQPEKAIEVFELLQARYPDLHIVFIGDGDQWGILERRIQSGSEAVRARVHMVGARENMVAVLSDLDVLLMTSRSEGMPVSLIEAAAAGIPVVSTPVGGVPELVAHERTGWLGESVDELGYGLAQYLDSEDLRRDAGSRARLRVRERHSGQALATRLEAVYEAAVGAHSGDALPVTEGRGAFA